MWYGTAIHKTTLKSETVKRGFEDLEHIQFVMKYKYPLKDWSHFLFNHTTEYSTKFIKGE